MICLTAFRRTAGLWLKRKLEASPVRDPRMAVFTFNKTLSEKSSGNDKYRTGSLVARERQVAVACWGKRSAGNRPSFGSHTLSQELDSGALRRARSFLLAGRDAGGAPGRPHGAHRDALRGAAPCRAARCAPRRTAGRPARARIARDRHRARVRQP